MTEIIPERIMIKARRLKGHERRSFIRGLVSRLEPLTGSQIGMMIDTNNLEAAHAMIRRINYKAFQAWKAATKDIPSDNRPRFKAPFWNEPANPAAEEGKWTQLLNSAFDAHI